jgi:hypothetical protein
MYGEFETLRMVFGIEQELRLSRLEHLAPLQQCTPPSPPLYRRFGVPRVRWIAPVLRLGRTM